MIKTTCTTIIIYQQSKAYLLTALTNANELFVILIISFWSRKMYDYTFLILFVYTYCYTRALIILICDKKLWLHKWMTMSFGKLNNGPSAARPRRVIAYGWYFLEQNKSTKSIIYRLHVASHELIRAALLI